MAAAGWPVGFRIDQVGIVVRDLERSLHEYRARHGWGPWSIYEYEPPRLRHVMLRGEPSAFTYLGAEVDVAGTGIELIQPLTGPGPYQEWLDEHGEGPHHVGHAAASMEEADAIRESYATLGVGVLTSGWFDEVFYYYLETAPVILEVWAGAMESVTPARTYP